MIATLDWNTRVTFQGRKAKTILAGVLFMCFLLLPLLLHLLLLTLQTPQSPRESDEVEATHVVAHN